MRLYDSLLQVQCVGVWYGCMLGGCGCVGVGVYGCMLGVGEGVYGCMLGVGEGVYGCMLGVWVWVCMGVCWVWVCGCLCMGVCWVWVWVHCVIVSVQCAPSSNRVAQIMVT